MSHQIGHPELTVRLIKEILSGLLITQRQMDMVTAATAVGCRAAHKCQMEIVLGRNLFADIFESEGLIGCIERMVMHPVYLPLTGKKLVIEVENVDTHVEQIIL